MGLVNKALLGVFCILLSVSAVQAKTLCLFTSECFEADGCQEAGFQLDYTKGGSAGSVAVNNGVQASTEFGDLGGYILTQTPDSATFVFEAPGARYFLTKEGREARLSVHMEGPMVITYLGTCEDLG